LLNHIFQKKELADKKFLRDPMNRVIGGVCAGIANYFGIERWLIRAGLLVFIFIPYVNYFSAIIVPSYIILWVSVPKGIQQNDSNFRSNNHGFISSLFGFFGGILVAFVRFFSKIIGAILLIALLISALIFYSIISYKGAYTQFFLPDNYNLEQLKYLLWFLFSLPWIAAFLIALTLLGRKIIVKPFYLFIAFLFWIIVLVYGLIVNISLLNQFNTSLKTAYEIPINSVEKTIDIMSSGAEFPKNSFSFGTDQELILGNLAIIDSGLISSDVTLRIEKFEGNDPKLFYKINSFGSDTMQARENQKKVSYNFQQSNNDIILSPYFKLLPNSKWRNQTVEMVLYLPVGYSIRINDAAAFHLTIQGLPDEKEAIELIGRNLQMTDGGLDVL
jgi:phage shock protein PspC (stress-responsive transcriptional regulator)